MAAKKKTEDTSETTAIKTPRKRATKTVVESEVVANDSVIAANAVVEVNEIAEIKEILETKEVTKVIEAKEVNETTDDKLIEDAETTISANTEVTQLDNLETIETTTDNNQTNESNENISVQEETNHKKEKKEGIFVQRKFYERVIGEKLEVTIQLEKLKITGIITYEHPFYILVETKQGQQFIYKQSISYISTKRSFTKLATRRDRPFFYRQNVDANNSASPTNEQVKEVGEVTYDASNRNENNLANSQ